MENNHKILCFSEHADHKIRVSAKSLNSLKILETHVHGTTNRVFFEY